MRSVVEKSLDIQTIRIHKSEIKNVVFKDKGKEFILNGEMYDIKAKFSEGDYTIFRCVNDKKEKQLLTELDRNTQTNIDVNSSSSQKQDDISKNILKDYFPGNKMISFCEPSQNSVRGCSHFPIHSFNIPLSAPPPVYIFS